MEPHIRARRQPTALEAAIPIAGMALLLGVGYGAYHFPVEILLIAASVVAGVVAITDTIADMALSSLAVDRRGLDKLDRRYIDWIDTVHGGGPVGIDTLATGLGEARETIEDVIEPFLVASGIITRTSRGRILTPKAYEEAQ